jgi:hypothetical protein
VDIEELVDLWTWRIVRSYVGVSILERAEFQKSERSRRSIGKVRGILPHSLVDMYRVADSAAASPSYS